MTKIVWNYRSSLIVDLFLKSFGHVPASVLHNLNKASMIKKCMWHLNVDQVQGAYVEFGVAMGHSLRSAEVSERTCYDHQLSIKRIKRRLIAFDTFNGFRSDSDDDKHPTWEGTRYNVSVETIKKRFRGDLNERIFLNQLDVQSLVDISGELTIKHEDCGLDGPIALILFDLDLGAPTFAALEWVRTRLQMGTILMFDEYFAFKGNPLLGEAGALRAFLSKYQSIKVREFSTYGSGGAVFVVSECSAM